MKKDSLVEVDGCGMHFTMIRRDVFEAIEPPWFVRAGRGKRAGAGSDFYFHGHAIEEAGIESFVDLSVVAGHLLGNWCIGALDFLAWHSITDYSDGGSRIGIEGEETNGD